MRVTSTLPKFELPSSEYNKLWFRTGVRQKPEAESWHFHLGWQFLPHSKESHFQFRRPPRRASARLSHGRHDLHPPQTEATGRKNRSKCSLWLAGSTEVGILRWEVTRNFLQFAFAQIVTLMYECQYPACGTVLEFWGKTRERVLLLLTTACQSISVRKPCKTQCPDDLWVHLRTPSLTSAVSVS